MIGILILLCIACVTDVLTHRVHLFVILAGIGMRICYLICRGTIATFLSSLLFGTLLFAILYLCMKYGSLGAGDVYIGFLLGFTLQVYGVYAIFFSFLFVLPYTIYLAFKGIKREYAFVPYLLTGTVVALCLMYAEGQKIPTLF